MTSGPPLQIPGLVLWTLTFRRIASRMVRFPVLFALLSASCSLMNALFVLLVLFPLFAQSDLAGRIAIRLLVLPVSTELYQAAVRALCAHWFRKALPTDVSVALLLPVTLLPALVGRFYTTSVESTAVSIGFSAAVAVIECIMRFTVPWRDRLYARWGHALTAKLPASLVRWWASLDERGEQWQAAADTQLPALKATGKSSRYLVPMKGTAGVPPAGVPAGSGASDAMRQRRMFYQFILLDTACEDVAAMLNIPIAVWFRLPAARGGAPIPLGSTLVRVAVQVVLEAATDLSAFIGYSVLRSLPEGMTQYSAVPVPLGAAPLVLGQRGGGDDSGGGANNGVGGGKAKTAQMRDLSFDVSGANDQSSLNMTVDPHASGNIAESTPRVAWLPAPVSAGGAAAVAAAAPPTTPTPMAGAAAPRVASMRTEGSSDSLLRGGTGNRTPPPSAPPPRPRRCVCLLSLLLHSRLPHCCSRYDRAACRRWRGRRQTPSRRRCMIPMQTAWRRSCIRCGGTLT